MISSSATFDLSTRKDWRGAFAALRRLLSNPNDTTQVFRIMRSLNAGVQKAGYERLLRSAEGGRLAYQRVELAERLGDPAFVASCPAGSVGAAYAAFLGETGYSADGLAAVSQADDASRAAQHPYAWFGRRTRDAHDLWHILTGYRANDPLGEACLVAFSYPQTGGLGWAFLAIGSGVKALRSPHRKLAIEALWEGYRHGRRAAWLNGQDYERVLIEPLASARKRLGIREPVAYHTLQTILKQSAGGAAD
jgi:ubiquinone biosynthesis protein COQ4